MSFTRLRYHFVTGTKNRQPFITPEVRPRLYELIHEEAEDAGGEIVELGGIDDHVHVVAAVRPDIAPATFMQRVKSGSSRRLPDEHEFEWQVGYGGFTLSPFNLRHVRKYVRNQEDHHGKSVVWDRYELLEELRELQKAA